MPQLPSHVDSFQAPFVYEEPVNYWVTRAKFGDQQEILPMMADFMLTILPKEGELFLPVPLHTSRLRKRLFNQSALLAKHLARKTGKAWHPTALQRIQKTAPQVGKTRKQRLKLSANAFMANPQLVYGKNIVLVDDIYTTGTTANACAKALKKAGAARVDVRTVAYVPI